MTESSSRTDRPCQPACWRVLRGRRGAGALLLVVTVLGAAVTAQWILTTTEHDGAIDFNRALSAAGLPNQLHAPYSQNLMSGGNDQLHPNSTGYKAMAGAVDLSWFGR